MSTSRSLPDQADRDAAANDLKSSAFIEAGAGTGKSTTLVNRIVNTITADPGVAVKNIAAITFTERAGAELRHRLRAGLTDALKKDPGNERLLEALADLDAAAIGTIHSFAQRILRSHALSAGLPLGFQPSAGGDASDVTRARVRAAVEDLEDSLDDHTRFVLDSYGLAPYDLAGVLGRLDLESLRLGPAAFMPDTTADVEALWAECAQQFEDFLLAARAECQDPSDKLMVFFEERIPPLIALLRGADQYEVAAAYPEALRIAVMGNKGAQGAWGAGGGPMWRDRLKELVPLLTACFLTPLELAVRTALARGWQVLEQQRELDAHQGAVTFDGLLSRACNLLETDPAVRAQVHEQFQVLLVDEFQDTDPVQWRMIRLVASDPHDPDAVPLQSRLIVVGDPKQAIYSFRGADIDTYRDALADFEKRPSEFGRIYKLSTNFRSVEPLIEWVNRVFDSAMSGVAFQVPYENLDVRHRPHHEKPGPAVTVLRDPRPEDGKPIDSEALEANLVAQEIARAVRDGWQVTEPVDGQERQYCAAARFSDIAILYPARTGVPKLLDALDDAGVPYRSSDAGLVLQRPAVLGILASMAVIDDPSCELDLWMALKSPLFGCTDIDLVRYRRAGGRWRLTSPGVDANGDPLTGPVAEAMDVLRRVRRTMDAPQPVDVIDQLMHRTRILEALSYAPRGAFDSDCLRMVRAHAQQFQDDGGVGLPDYLRAVADLRTDSTKSSLSEPDDRDDNAVRLMTIHQAKGLEFPIVVLGAMASTIYNPSPSIGIVERDRYEFSLGKDLRSLHYTEWDQSERQPRSDAERIRLDYVACTRARDHLIVSICGEYGRKTKRHSTLLWPSIPAEPDHITALDPEPVVVQVPAEQPPPPLPENWQDTIADVRARAKQPFVALPSGTAAAALGVTQVQWEPSEDETDLEPRRSVETTTAADSRATRDGRPLGRAVHAALDTMVRSGSPLTPDDVEQACRRACEDEGILDELGVIRARVASALGTDLMLQALAAERRWSELYLAAPVEGSEVTLVEGFADLLFETSDGQVLVDYKTDEVISNETRQHYAEQLATYDELLRLATGRSAVRRVILHLPSEGATVLSIDA